MTDALRIELVQYEDVERKIKMGDAPRAVAKKVIEAAIVGEPWAITFIYDRMDGKPMQRTETKHEHTVETVSEEHARLVAEGFLESLRSHTGDSAQEPDRLHDSISSGLPGG